MAERIDDYGMSHGPDTPEWMLVQGVIAGDVDQFETLLRRHSAGVARIVARRIPAQDVEVVSQEVFVTAFQSLGTYEGRQPFEHWLARIARRRSCDYWRERERRNATVNSPLAVDDCAWIELAADEFASRKYHKECRRAEIADLIRVSLASLDAESRALMESIYFEEVPLREVAATFGWSLAKVKVKAYRIRRHLRARLESLLKEEKQT
jgi:RNA polymerase sigma-70 factor (ECF subfamily)